MTYWAAGAAIGGAVISSMGSKSAGSQQSAGQQQAAAQQLAMFQVQEANQKPYLQAGETALNEVMGGLGLPGGTNNSTTKGQFTHQFDANDLQSNLAPNYQFQLGQGLNSTANLMNLNSGAFSGNTLKAINDYSQNYAGGAYQQAFQNYNTNQQNVFSRLSSVAGMGQATSANQAQVSANYAQSIGSNIAGAGASQAGGTVGSTNAIAGGINNAASWYTLGNVMNRGGGGGSSNFDPGYNTGGYSGSQWSD